MSRYTSESDYISDLQSRAFLPKGFKTAGLRFHFSPAELPGEKTYPMDLSAIVLDRPTDAFGGVFTKNAFTGAPVQMNRELIEAFDRRRLNGAQASSDGIRGVLINNKIANVGAPGGLDDARRLTKDAARLIGGGSLFSASTGVIGWRLPVDDMERRFKELVAGLNRGDAVDLARRIMTTDRFPKVRSVQLGEGRIVAVAKGAGMIEPDMGTMLSFLMTDIDLPREVLQQALSVAVEQSFNRISIDGDQSTSDMALLFSSRRVAMAGREGSGEEEAFTSALTGLCKELAEDLVRNGEGAGHIMEVRVCGAADKATALGTAKAIVNSLLVKTAVYGNDPNVGRILMAAGDYLGSRDEGKRMGTIGAGIDDGDSRAGVAELFGGGVELIIGGETVFSGGTFELDQEKEARLSGYLEKKGFDPSQAGYPEHEEKVEIILDFKAGNACERVIGSDLSYEYVRENAEYRT